MLLLFKKTVHIFDHKELCRSMAIFIFRFPTIEFPTSVGRLHQYGGGPSGHLFMIFQNRCCGLRRRREGGRRRRRCCCCCCCWCRRRCHCCGCGCRCSYTRILFFFFLLFLFLLLFLSNFDFIVDIFPAFFWLFSDLPYDSHRNLSVQRKLDLFAGAFLGFP